MRQRKGVSHPLTLFLIRSVFSSLTSCQAFLANNPPATPTIIVQLTNTPIAPANVLWVDTTRDLGPISKFTLGANYGAFAEIGAGNIDAVKNSGLAFLRWSGGHWGDQYKSISASEITCWMQVQIRNMFRYLLPNRMMVL